MKERGNYAGPALVLDIDKGSEQERWAISGGLYEKLKVLVTGGTGFIGSQLILELVHQGYDVYSLERYMTGRFVLGQPREVKTVFGDLRNYSAIRNVVREVQPDAIIHLAAISAVSYSYEHPHEVTDANFYGTMNLAEACMEIPHLQAFLFASTSETYGNNGHKIKNEESPQNPNSPYAVSKLASEKYLLYLRDSQRFPVTILRNFNSYGRKENSHFVIERTIAQMLQGKSVKLGDPFPIRDFEYVDDHVSSYIACLKNPRARGEIFNFCTGRGISIADLVSEISDICEFRGEIIWNAIPKRPLDILELVGDYSKAESTLGWRPKFSLEKGLRLTVDFWRDKLSETTRKPKTVIS
jgi:nucleoside-diphosphate-sugar epimerase